VKTVVTKEAVKTVATMKAEKAIVTADKARSDRKNR